jgi:hypothetical protein
MPPLSWTLRDSPAPAHSSSSLPRLRGRVGGCGLTPSVSGRVRTHPLLSRVPFRPQSLLPESFRGGCSFGAASLIPAGARPLLRACNQPCVCSTGYAERPAGCRLSWLENLWRRKASFPSRHLSLFCPDSGAHQCHPKRLGAVVSRTRGSERSSHALHAVPIACSRIPPDHRLVSRSGRISAIPMRPPTSIMMPQIMNPVLNPASGVAAVSTTLPIT